jgi:hypothetical protein
MRRSDDDDILLIYADIMHASQYSISKKVLGPFFAFAALFIGTGFISGSIVHLGEGVNAWDLSVLGTGVLLFTLGSCIQEAVFNGRSLREEGMLKFLFTSLVLSIGIGMASGGMQHFADTPSYSAVLIPVGLAIGMVAFVFKQNVEIPNFRFKMFAASALVFAVIGVSGLRYVAHQMEHGTEVSASHSHMH